MKLYELTEQHRQLEALSTDSDLDLADTFEGLEGEFNEKAISLIHVTKNIDSDILAIDYEIKRLSDLKKAKMNAINSMKDYLRTNMQATGITKIECPLFTISLGKPRKIAEVTDVDKLPPEYIRIKTSVTPVKADILKALKSGEDIPGAELAESKPLLRIY